jgi:TolB protein
VWSRSGDELAYVTDRNGTDEIWIRSRGADRPVVTEHDFPSGSTYYLAQPAFSPDGRRIAYSRRVRGGTTSIWISPVSGGPAVRLLAEAIPQASPDWAPDGNWIAYESRTGGKAKLMKARVGGSGGNYILKENLIITPPQWSPDGNWITYATADEFGVVSTDGQQTRKLANGTWRANRWSRSGKLIYAVKVHGGQSVLFSLDTRSGVQQMLSVLDTRWGMASVGRPDFSISPDEKLLLVSLYKRKAEVWLLENFQQRLGILQAPWRKHIPD